MELFDRLDAVRERWNVLRHPFYLRWSEGALEREELSFYAGEYRHAVHALADQTAAAAGDAGVGERPELARHAAEERAHVELWDDFASWLGADTRRAPLPETAACVEAWTAGEDLVDRLAILYVIEASQPAISETKLAGLVDHYGASGGEPAAAYFALHAVRDHEHAEHSRRLLADRVSDHDSDRLAGRAEAALECNWRLLDGVERSPARV